MAAIARPSFIRPRNRVMVASGDAVFRSLMMRSREDSGALSEEAVGGAHALSKLLHYACDSVLLDRHLPDLDAKEVAELIRQRYPQMEVEFVDSQRVGGEHHETQVYEGKESPCGRTKTKNREE